MERKQWTTENDHSLEWINYENLEGNLFVEMQNWALDECWKEPFFGECDEIPKRFKDEMLWLTGHWFVIDSLLCSKLYNF